MPNLFITAVTAVIFTGSSLMVKAQPSVNIEKMSASAAVKKSPKFIPGIVINGHPVRTGRNITGREFTEGYVHEPTLVIEPAPIENCTALQFKYALMLDMDVENVTNTVLFEEIDKWLDTRYRFGGTTEKGIDCSAYTGTLLTDVYGLNVSRTSRNQYAESEKIQKDKLQQGDLVFFNTRRRGRGVSHVGLYLGNGYFTHAGSSTGVTISNLDDTYWSSKYLGGGRINQSASTATAATE